MQPKQAKLAGRRKTAVPKAKLRWLAFLASLGWLLLSAGLIPGAEAEVSKEYKLKAAFLYNFTKFIQWPGETFQDEKAPIVIGLFGQNPFGRELQIIVDGRKVNGRGLVVKHVETAEAARTAHLVFVSEEASARFGEVKRSLEGARILTVGESESFRAGGGIINFVLERDKLRFEINMDEADRAGLKISAELQKLAKTVRRNH